MNRLAVARVLEAMGTFRYRSTIHGFDLFIRHLDERNSHLPLRLTHGGGIACQSHIWWLERPEAPVWRSTMVSTRLELHRLITEYMAGPKPPDREGYTQFAKLHTYGGNTNYVWMYVKLRRRKSAVERELLRKRLL